MKKQRGLKRYYRNLAIQNDFEKMLLDFSDTDQWYDMWHLHFDWKGFGDNSFKRRKPHLDKLFRHFEILAEKIKGLKKEFHVFALINDFESHGDSLYIHTSNPNQRAEFPLVYPHLSILDTLSNKELQIYLDDLEGYVKLYGMSEDEICRDEAFCILYKNNVGIPIVYDGIQ